MSGKTPNYVLTEDHIIECGPLDSKLLMAGSFVRPINTQYIPEHILEAHKYVDVRHSVFCYSHFGLILVPKDKIRTVG